MSFKSNKKRKALALALAISLNLSAVSPIGFAEDTEQTAPAELSAPATEGETPTENSTDDTDAGDTGDKVPQQQTSTTVWDPANSEQCSENTMCDPANVSPEKGQGWKDIVSILAILFGERSSGGDSETANIGGSVIPTDTNPITVTDPELPEEFTTIAPLGDPDATWSDIPAGPDLSGIQLGLLGGIPLSPNASYSWSRTGPGAIKVQALVYPLNPEIDTTTKFGALVTSTNPSVHVYPPAQYASETYSEGGTYSKVFKFMTMEYAKNHAPRFGSVMVKVNAKIYEGTTALCSPDDSSCDNGLEAGSEFDNNGNLISNTGGSTTNTGSSDLGGLNGIGTNIGDYLNNTGTSGLGGSDTLDNLFNNDGTNSSSNASSPYWLTDGFSSNNSGDSNNGTVPTDFGSQFANDSNNTTTDNNPFTTANTDSNNEQFAYTDSNGTASVNGTANNNRTDTTPSNGSTEDGPLNTIFSKIDSVIGNDPSSANSLTSKFSSLINTGDKTAKIMAEMTPAKRLPGTIEDSFTAASNAELADVAKQMLIGYGTSQEDIKAGKLFDADSAYTDPQDAWNLNRMSTILKSKNISVK